MISLRVFLLGVLLIAAAAPLHADTPVVLAPSRAPSVGLAVVHAVIHPGTGPAISDATLVVRDGRIVSVGRGVPPADLPVVDVPGHHLYPSLIDPDTLLGLIEIEAARATHDFLETGTVNADLRADVAFNPESQLLPVAMSSGIIVACTAPRGGLISGRSAVMTLSGWTREDMTVRAPAGLYVNWPRMTISRQPWSPPAKKQEKTRREALRQLDDVFENSRAYMRAGTIAEERDVQWDAMAAVLRRDIPVIVRADGLAEIRAALTWSARQNVRMVLLGGRDAWRVAKELAQADVGVIYTHVLSVPRRDFEAYDTNYRAPAILEAAGVRVALSVGGEASNVRWLADLAGRARAYGLGDLESLQAITLRPAELLGVADRLGSLASGKDATFFLADGDILDTRTHVLRAWVQGLEIDLNDRQKQLWAKYRNRPHAGKR